MSNFSVKNKNYYFQSNNISHQKIILFFAKRKLSDLVNCFDNIINLVNILYNNYLTELFILLKFVFDRK